MEHYMNEEEVDYNSESYDSNMLNIHSIRDYNDNTEIFSLENSKIF